jgi:hypothetical protein
MLRILDVDCKEYNILVQNQIREATNQKVLSWNFFCVLHFQDLTQLNIFSSYVNNFPPGLNEPNGPLNKNININDKKALRTSYAI